MNILLILAVPVSFIVLLVIGLLGPQPTEAFWQVGALFLVISFTLCSAAWLHAWRLAFPTDLSDWALWTSGALAFVCAFLAALCHGMGQTSK